MAEQPLTDREQVIAWKEEQEAESRAVQQVMHYQALGIGLAVFCQTMLGGLLAPPAEGDEALFSRAEALALVAAAVRGR